MYELDNEIGIENLKEYIQFSIQTNGTLINDEIIEFIKRYDIHMGLSIDGIKEVHDKIGINYYNTLSL